MLFKIEKCHEEVTDAELSALLDEVYVQGGFIRKDVAESVFEPNKVKARGQMLCARDTATSELVGMVIVVPPTSSTVVRAKQDECEMHLLGVKNNFRNLGVGKQLVSHALAFAQENHWKKMILWTQLTMTSAHKLYESFGFVQTDKMVKSDIAFIVYEKELF
ncbi:GNAT family N-acetyltransferase [Hydrogenovibrio marinus]|uniref:N-acetyltransferase domain-containing protein n=1 Tax=Hydrogenovibrio marinus TaxID=28885 RepID=A0A066ZY55_HYDMR|nr:GNAT family N-acetyltransferase [Hydrogenovibrio marinus]KDN95281.1 hypothetical protein EI16_02960 [Hydrogenovibrio marinus]BBN59760.1 N-acetyltransferase [Hydrogenovibrio marinus]